MLYPERDSPDRIAALFSMVKWNSQYLPKGLVSLGFGELRGLGFRLDVVPALYVELQWKTLKSEKPHASENTRKNKSPDWLDVKDDFGVVFDAASLKEVLTLVHVAEVEWTKNIQYADAKRQSCPVIQQMSVLIRRLLLNVKHRLSVSLFCCHGINTEPCCLASEWALWCHNVHSSFY